jgi:Icc-related predicted phosphoesterase
MRLLVLSDIHDNIEHIQLLRAQVQNVYDAVIVAGDIGNSIVQEFYSILDSFECPAFCVYGNWDHDQEYRSVLSQRCKLVHHTIETIGQYVLSGFSGSPTSWGRNPFYLDEQRRLNQKHRDVLALEEAALSIIKSRMAAIEGDYADVLLALDARTEDHSHTAYKQKIRDISAKKIRAINRVYTELRKLHKTPAHKAYTVDSASLPKLVLERNRTKLFKLLETSRVPQDKLIVLTHERLYRTAEEGLQPLLHIYGHIHEHSFRTFKGTHYLNAAAIDNGFSEFFGKEKLHPVGYCVLVLDGAQIIVERRHIPVHHPDDEGLATNSS